MLYTSTNKQLLVIQEMILNIKYSLKFTSCYKQITLPRVLINKELLLEKPRTI